MTSRSRANKLIAAATKQCNNDVVSSVNSIIILPHSENERLTNILFSQIMKDKSSDERNTDFKNNAVVVDNNNIYEEIIAGPNQINVNNCLTDSSSTVSSEILSRDTEDWLPKSVINQNNLNLSGSSNENNSENNSTMDIIENNILNVNSSKGPSRQLFGTSEILFSDLETCSISNSFLGIECLEDGENQLEEVCVVGEEGEKKEEGQHTCNQTTTKIKWCR